MPNLRTFGMTWGDFAYAFGQGLPASVRGIMNGMRIPQTYYPRESLVHRLDARVKLALLIAVTIALFQVTTWRGLAVFALLVLLALKASHLPAGVMMRSLIPFYVLMLFAVLVNSLSLNPQVAGAYGIGGVSAGIFAGSAPLALAGGWWLLPEGMARSLFYCLRILLMVLASLLVAYSTEATRLSSGFLWFIGPLRKLRVPVDDIASVFTLVLRFIPLAFEQLGRIKLAQMARAASFQAGGLWKRVSAWGPVMIPWFVGMYRGAGRVATAMEVRGYGQSARRTSLCPLVFTRVDALVLLAGLVCCVLPCVAFV